MKTVKKIVKIGNSLGIIINKILINYLEIKKGDLIEIEIKKLEDKEVKE